MSGRSLTLTDTDKQAVLPTCERNVIGFAAAACQQPHKLAGANADITNA